MVAREKGATIMLVKDDAIISVQDGEPLLRRTWAGVRGTRRIPLQAAR